MINVPLSLGIYCEIPKNIIVEDSSKIGRLVFPLVVKNVQNHFSCFNKSDFGGPLSLLTQDNITGSVSILYFISHTFFII